MANLIVMVGLPGSGKTTWAEREQQANYGSVVIVSRDDLREKLFRAEGVLRRQMEDLITEVEDQIVIRALVSGFDVIVDSMNLRPEYIERWRSIAHTFGASMKLIRMTASVETCIDRDRERGARGGRSVGADVIRRLAERVDRAR